MTHDTSSVFTAEPFYNQLFQSQNLRGQNPRLRFPLIPIDGHSMSRCADITQESDLQSRCFPAFELALDIMTMRYRDAVRK
jgi:hypothetical protein